MDHLTFMINRCYANDNIKQPRAILVPDHKLNRILFYKIKPKVFKMWYFIQWEASNFSEVEMLGFQA